MMSKCCGNNNDARYFEKPNAGICDICHPAENKKSPIEDIAMCPPIGEPRVLNMMAPVVFDESGINLCRTVCLDELEDVCNTESRENVDILFDGLTKCDLRCANKLQLQVVDIDFNFVDPCDCRYSEIVPAKCNPNLSRITLKDINVTLAVSVINECCKVVKQGMMTIKYLGNERSCAHDPITNPSCITFDLYTPYGVSYAAENPLGCNKLVPVINYMGFVGAKEGNESCSNLFPVNNTIQQGISAQALAKVVAYNEGCFAIGLTLYIQSIYFVQYKFRHEGLTVAPKLSPVEEEQVNNCLDFVTGDLLETSIRPLSVGQDAKTTEGTNDNDGCGCKGGCDPCSCNTCGCNTCGCKGC